MMAPSLLVADQFKDHPAPQAQPVSKALLVHKDLKVFKVIPERTQPFLDHKAQRDLKVLKVIQEQQALILLFLAPKVRWALRVIPELQEPIQRFQVLPDRVLLLVVALVKS